MEIKSIANGIWQAVCVCGWKSFPGSSWDAQDRTATMHTNHCEKHQH